MAGRTLNRVTIIGNLAASPELRSLPDGTAVSNFSVVTTESWVDKSGGRKEEAQWHRVTFFGRIAEVLHEYGRKGAKVFIEGALRTRKWTDKDGNERHTTEIRGNDFIFLSAPAPYRSSESGGGGHDHKHGRHQHREHSDGGHDYSSPGESDDDVPF